MEPKDRILLETIENYCNTLIDALHDYSIDDASLRDNLALRGMTAFFVQQIGECANKMSPDFKTNYSEIDWRAMAGLRNRIAHAYGKIDVEILWDVVLHDIPELLAFCKKVLAN